MSFSFLYLGMLAFGVSFFVLAPSFFTFFFLLLILIKILFTKNPRIIFLCFIGGCLVATSAFHQLERNKKHQQFVLENEQWADFELEVLIDTIKVNGDLLTFTADTKAGRVQTVYFLQSEGEQHFFQNITENLRLIGTGELASGTPQRNWQGFDYRRFLQQQNFLGSLRITAIDSIEQTQTPSLRVLRRKAIVYIQRTFPMPIREYMTGLLFGFLTHDFEENREMYRTLGVVHLFTLSGMQAGFFFKMFRKLLLRFGLTQEAVYWLTLVFAFVYSGLTGYSISVMRAILQKILELTEKRFDWKQSKQSIYGLIVFITVLFRPYLFFTVSAQLSFGLGFLIVFLLPICRNYEKKWQQQIIFSIGLSIGILPLIWWHFFEWNPLSIVLTVVLSFVFDRFLLPFLTFAFFSSFLLFLPQTNSIIEIFEGLLLYLHQEVSFQMIIGKPTIFSMMILMFAVIWGLYCLENKRLKKLAVTIWLFILVGIFTTNRPSGFAAMVDVGQGDSFFIQEPFSQKVTLIDVGGRAEFRTRQPWQERKSVSNADRTLIPFLKARGVRTIHHLYLTHAHEDHYGDVLAVANHFQIENVYYAKGTQKDGNFRVALETLYKKGIRVVALQAPARLEEGILLFPETTTDGKNNDSLVIQKLIGGKRFLFTGDIEEEAEKRILRLYPELRTDILKVAHQGSRTSSTPEFIEQVQPQVALISAGENNQFGHPHQETLDILEEKNVEVFRTDKHGMIYFEISPFTRKLSEVRTVR